MIAPLGESLKRSANRNTPGAHDVFLRQVLDPPGSSSSMGIKKCVDFEEIKIQCKSMFVQVEDPRDLVSPAAVKIRKTVSNPE